MQSFGERQPDIAAAQGGNDLAFASIEELSKLLRARKISALELTRLALQRLSKYGTRYNALAELMFESAEADARRADRRLRRHGSHHPLLGIPYGAKDLFATKGVPTRWGAPPYRDQVFDYDATVVGRLRQAGAVLTAKLSMIQLAGAGGYGSPAASLDGPCVNPWSRLHWSGGSSSGSGAAVSAGLVPFALGSDTRGSITTPAAFCGVTGLRPTYGAVSRFGVMTLAWSLDKVGPMARTAADCERVFAAMVGHDPRDPTSVDWRYRPTRKSAFVVGVLPLQPGTSAGTARAFEEALDTLRGIGATRKRVSLPVYDYYKIAQDLIAAETAAAHEDLIRDGQRLRSLVDKGQRQGMRRHLRQPNVTYARAWVARVAAARSMEKLFQDVDVLAMPTMPTEAFRLNVDLTAVPRYGLSGILGAVCGIPGISLPMGFGPSGLPLGLSLVSAHFRESALLRIAAMFQRASDWHLRIPPIATD